MHTATADPLVGRLLEGRYRLESLLARGGMSTVYSALDERLDRRVAVKIMSPSLSQDPAFVDRFSREARAAAKLAHLNAVAVFDQGIDRGDSAPLVFLVMELVSGRTLRDLIRERGRLSPAEAVSIMEPVLAALAAAHRAGLVHRDVKPENILLSDDGVVKVADFGLARAVETDGANTRTGLMMGTVAYCSPEQISRGTADQRSDVYSAGVVFFELLTGAAPYTGDSAVNVAYRHVHERVPAPSSRVPGIAPVLDELVVGATDSDPGGRPMDAGVFLAELADVRSHLGLPVVPVSPRPRASEVSGAAPAGTLAFRATDPLSGSAGPHDTLAVGPGLRPPGQLPPHSGAIPPPPQYSGAMPPPPPYSGAMPPPGKPPKQPKVRTRSAIRRRRSLIALLIVLLVGAGAAFGGWWLVAGRFGSIPAVADLSESAATAALRHAGYEVSGQDQVEFSNSVAKAMVIGTDPGAGSRAAHGRTVTLIVSKGKDLVAVPTVAGKDPAAAEQLLSTVFAHVTQVQKPSETVKSGLVIGTNPSAGTPTAPSTTVDLYVSSGFPILQVPNVVGATQPAAIAELGKDGFTATVSQDFSTTVPTGNVISQNPVGSTPEREHSAVAIVVSKGKPNVQIPAIAEGTPIGQAKSELEGLGLVVKLQKSFGGHLGILVGMSLDPGGSQPAAGLTVPIGTTVYLTYA